MANRSNTVEANQQVPRVFLAIDGLNETIDKVGRVFLVDDRCHQGLSAEHELTHGEDKHAVILHHGLHMDVFEYGPDYQDRFFFCYEAVFGVGDLLDLEKVL